MTLGTLSRNFRASQRGPVTSSGVTAMLGRKCIKSSSAPAGDSTCEGIYFGPHLCATAPVGGLVAQLWQNLFAPGRADVAFVCKDGIAVRGNRAALSAAAHFFDALLNRHWRESELSEIPLPTVDAHLLRDYVFEHFRTGLVPNAAVDDDIDTVLEAYELARQYCLPTLEVQLLRAVARKLDLGSASWVLRRALDSEADELTQSCLEFLARAWQRSVTGLAIAGMLPNALTQLLQTPPASTKPVPPEHCFEAIIEWGREQLGLRSGIWQGELCGDGRAEFLELIQPLLAHVRLEDMPATFLEKRVEPLKIFSQERLMEVYKTQAKAACHSPRPVERHSFWDASCMPLSVGLLDSRTVEFRGCVGHVGVRSKLALTCGKWEWQLQFTNIGRKYAWAGVVDATADLDVFPGSQAGGFLYGSSGLLRSRAVAAASAERAGGGWHHSGAVVTAHLDMDTRELGFSVDGAFVGILFRSLPPCVFPAASLSGGGAVRFVSIDAAAGMPKSAA